MARQHKNNPKLTIEAGWRVVCSHPLFEPLATQWIPGRLGNAEWWAGDLLQWLRRSQPGPAR